MMSNNSKLEHRDVVWQAICLPVDGSNAVGISVKKPALEARGINDASGLVEAVQAMLEDMPVNKIFKYELAVDGLGIDVAGHPSAHLHTGVSSTGVHIYFNEEHNIIERNSGVAIAKMLDAYSIDESHVKPLSEPEWMLQ